MMNLRTVLRTAAAALLVVTAGAVTQQAGTEPAHAAISGLRYIAADSPTDSSASKLVSAYCPQGMQVVGGGASVDGPTSLIMLTAAAPFETARFTGFWAVAYERRGNLREDWTLTAYAICAPALPGWRLVERTTASDSEAFKGTLARCPRGTRALGAGGVVNGPAPSVDSTGRVGLHMVRPDGALTIGRATAREDVSDYSRNWSLTAYAICANALEGMHVAASIGAIEIAVVCPDGYLMLGAGGGGSPHDAGPHFIHTLMPEWDFSRMVLRMTSPPDDGVAVHATCVVGS